MPKATAVWLVENTSLTFDQIAEFCKLHPLEVKGIADGEVATGIKGYDADLDRAAQRAKRSRLARRIPQRRLQLSQAPRCACRSSRSRAARATRRCRAGRIGRMRSSGCCAITPELKDAQIMRLVGTTKHTLDSRSVSAVTGTAPTSSLWTR